MIKFKEKSPKAKKAISNVVSFIVLVIVVAYLILLIGGKVYFGGENRFYRSINVFSDSDDYSAPLRAVSAAMFIITVAFVLRVVLAWIASWLNKGKAFVNMLSSLVKYIALIALLYLLLRYVGVNTVTLLSGLGIIGLVFGLAAQPLLEDVLAGLFIVFEGVFDVGDIIVYDEFRGEVTEIGVRTTKLLDAGGNVKVVNNSDLRSFVNMTDSLSVVIGIVQIEYGESLKRVEKVIADNIESIRASIPAFVKGPDYVGVSELGTSGVSLKFLAYCREQDRFQAERDLNRAIKLMFDENGINIPFTQVVLHNAKD